MIYIPDFKCMSTHFKVYLYIDIDIVFIKLPTSAGISNQFRRFCHAIIRCAFSILEIDIVTLQNEQAGSFLILLPVP
jgi:hypothetical protein